MTPVINNAGKSEHLPTSLFNKFGYKFELDEGAEFGGLNIDYVALAAHIVALDKEARKLRYGIWPVIFDPTLQPNFYEKSMLIT